MVFKEIKKRQNKGLSGLKDHFLDLKVPESRFQLTTTITNNIATKRIKTPYLHLVAFALFSTG